MNQSKKILRKEKHTAQARNQNFFRVGEVSWNQGPVINISLKNTRKKGPGRINLGVFSPRYS